MPDNFEKNAARRGKPILVDRPLKTKAVIARNMENKSYAGEKECTEHFQAINLAERNKEEIVSTFCVSNKYWKSDNEANALLNIKHVQNGIDKLCAYEISENLLHI